MSTYYIEKMIVNELWGYKDFEITFNKDVNIIIGPNASGKTTLLNILRYIFTVDIVNLMDIKFRSANIKLRGFTNKKERTIIVFQKENGINYYVSNRKYEFDLPTFHSTTKPREFKIRERLLKERSQYQELFNTIQSLVDAVWLPVSRRLPIREEEEVPYSRRNISSELESVDVRLRDLLQGLIQYRLRLEGKKAINYKDFEKRVLTTILYNKQYDTLKELPKEPPTQEDKEQLLRAFEAAGLLDQHMRNRIDDHFSIAQAAVERFKKYISERETGLDANTAFVIPLINRTKSIVEYARILEEDRRILFVPLTRFEEIVDSFLNQKNISINDNGNLIITSIATGQELELQLLSSGEKQILILLTQALLWEDKPVIYVVDEPELSLHVLWQEKLLPSLVVLSKYIQVIVATHSPDIVGPYINKVIDLGEKEQ